MSILKNLGKGNPVFSELSVNGYSILDDIIHIGSQKMKENKSCYKSKDICHLFDIVVNYLSPEQKQTLAANITQDRNTLLRFAVKSADKNICEKVHEFLSANLQNQAQLNKLILTDDLDGFTVLHDIAAMNQPDSLRKSITFIQKVAGDDVLKELANKRNNLGKGYLPQAHAKKAGVTEKIYDEIEKILNPFRKESNRPLSLPVLPKSTDITPDQSWSNFIDKVDASTCRIL